MKNSNPFAYQNGMIDIKSDILKIVLDETSKFEYKNYTKDDVFKALNSKIRTQNDLKALLSMVQKAGGTVEGIGIVIEKTYQGGGDEIRKQGYNLLSLAKIKSMENGTVQFAD